MFVLKTKQGEVIKSWYQKALFTLNMFPKNKQNKLRQKKNNEFKEEIYSNYTTIMKYAISLFFYISSNTY